MKTAVKNHLYLGIFCALIGTVCGGVIWAFLKVLSVGVTFLWEWIPGEIHIPYYTLLVCTAGGICIGFFRRCFGDYPEELQVVLGKWKKEKRYEYRKMLIMLIAAFLPLLIGSSVGPEAGLTGVIVGLCCWAGENLRFARHNAKAYSEIGTAVTLGVLFRSPLFGIFSVEEEEGMETVAQLSRSLKLLLYGIALAGASGIYLLLSALFGAGMGGFPSFPFAEITQGDYLMLIPYILAGCVLAVFYKLTHAGTESLAGRVPPVLREALGGFCLGLVGMWVPMMMFSGEEEMAELMTEYGNYIPLVLIGMAFLKVLLTNICIQSGLKGGHFFPVIFAGVCLGYGIAVPVLGGGGHEVFAAAIVTAALLGGIMGKPLAVTMLLFLCFPVRMFMWIFLAAVIGNKAVNFRQNKESVRQEGKMSYEE